jgi:hypothetical protein
MDLKRADTELSSENVSGGRLRLALPQLFAAIPVPSINYPES